VDGGEEVMRGTGGGGREEGGMRGREEREGGEERGDGEREETERERRGRERGERERGERGGRKREEREREERGRERGEREREGGEGEREYSLDEYAISSTTPQLTQVYTTYSNQSTGQLSFITCALNFGGAASRIFTTLRETQDPIMLFMYCTNFTVSGIIVLQFYLYGSAAKKVKKLA
jgi:hypothetical protein